MAVIDLTGPTYEGMWTYGPPLPEVRLPRLATLDREGWDAHLIHMANIQGTTITTAAHLMPDQPTIDQVPVERFMVRSAVLQLADKMPREHITLADLTGAGVDAQPGMGILVAAGWDRMWRDTGFFWESPHFTREAMQWIGDKRPAILGLDFPSSNDPRAPEGLNSIIFATGTLLLAPLVNLRRLSKQYVDLIALPLRIPGLCGTPCRAVAIEQ